MGTLFCRSCGSQELVAAGRQRCATCGNPQILTFGTLRATIVGYHRDHRPGALLVAAKRLLREAGASWPERQLLRPPIEPRL